MYGNELSSSILDKLIANEMVYANRQKVSTMSGKKDLTGYVNPLIIVDRKTGKVHELYTVNDMTSFMDAQGIGNTYTIHEYAKKAMGIINGSTM